MNYPEGADNSKAPWNQPDESRDECPMCHEPRDCIDFTIDYWGRELDVCEGCESKWEAFTGTCVECQRSDRNPHAVCEGSDLVLCDQCHLDWIFSGEFADEQVAA